MNYGRNFEFRVSPPPDQRGGRYVTGATPIPIGAPVVAGAVNADGRNVVAVAAGAIDPVPGIHGLLVFEYAWAAYAGRDPFLTVSSDLDFAPANAPVQLVSGTENKVVLRNTVDDEFLTPDNIVAGKVYVAPANLAGLAVGNGLRPHNAGSDEVGWWQEVGVDEAAWLIITNVDAGRGEVEARLAF